MEETINYQSDAFNKACQEIFILYPEAIGVAFKGLDCGCALVCGVSARGEPVGSLIYVSGQPGRKGKKSPICLKCKKDDGLDRVVREGIIWPGEENERPNVDLRLSIGKKVFGPDYQEP